MISNAFLSSLTTISIAAFSNTVPFKNVFPSPREPNFYHGHLSSESKMASPIFISSQINRNCYLNLTEADLSQSGGMLLQIQTEALAEISAWITPQTKEFLITKSLGIICLYLVRRPVNTRLICQFRGDITMSFRCDHALKQLVHGFFSFLFDMAPRLRLGTISRGTWKPWTNLYLADRPRLRSCKHTNWNVRIY